MKRFTFELILVSLFIISFTQFTFGQNLGDLDTIAHYSMINTAMDDQGKYSDIELINTPFQNSNGVYCNGLYINGFNPDGSLVRTPSIEEVFDSTFAIRVEFKVDSIPPGVSPIFICGDSYRYLGMMIQWDSLAMYVINDHSYEIPAAPISTHEWHTATAIYSVADTTATYWIDGQQVAIAHGALHRPAFDKNISNTHFGLGATFEGNLRNLTIFSSRGVLSKTHTASNADAVRIYPNPATNLLFAENADLASWIIYTLDGRVIASGETLQNQPIDISNLIPGTYSIAFSDPHGLFISRHLFLKTQ
jgi:hypothetical protein